MAMKRSVPDAKGVKELVLVGGGHAHALLLLQWGKNPLPGTRIILVSPDIKTPYSGMLPGFIAGHYDFDEMHIDLSVLAQWAGIRFIQSCVIGIDPGSRQVFLEDQQELAYDVLSINTGSTPTSVVPGVKEHAIPIKPISEFWQHWQGLLQQLRASDEKKVVAVVGGGAGSVEAVLAMAWACKNDSLIAHTPDFHLVFQADSILPGYPARVRKTAQASCKQLNITLHGKFCVTEVFRGHLKGEGGRILEADFICWCAQASAPVWPEVSGLACENGFIAVNEYLQSVSHPEIFAAGDVAHMVASPRPKAGVYAVRQAPYLFKNLCRYLQNQSLAVFTPQDKFLSLLALGGKKAAGNRGPLSFSGTWVWRWKNSIDQKFMAQFHKLKG